MTEEEIVRHEAQRRFGQRNISLRRFDANQTMGEIKQAILNFYAPALKAVYLDEVKNIVSGNLQKHRDAHHSGEASPSCLIEVEAEKLLFFITQELTTFPTIAHAKKVASPSHERSKVFISYSHVDQKYLEEIKRHFKPFSKQIDYWDDSKILPGQKWREEIRAAIDRTKVAILLVSVDFLGSEFIQTNELPPLLVAAAKDGAAILNIWIRPILADGLPQLTEFQGMNPLDKPVSGMDETEREMLYVNLVRQTQRILDQ